MERINALLVGAPRQGKSHFGEEKLIQYARQGGCSVVYNVGKPQDFSKFLPVEIMTVQQYRDMWEIRHRKKMQTFEVPRRVEFFKFNGQIYHLSQFSKLFSGKCVKIERVLNDGMYRNEDYFIASVYNYFYNTFLMFDDCRTIFRKGLSSEMIGLLSRINHAGKNFAPNHDLIGVDTMLTYHGFNTVNVESYQLINLIIQFRTMFAPKARIENDEMEQAINENYERLKETEKYSHFEFDLFTLNNTFFKP